MCIKCVFARVRRKCIKSFLISLLCEYRRFFFQDLVKRIGACVLGEGACEGVNPGFRTGAGPY